MYSGFKNKNALFDKNRTISTVSVNVVHNFIIVLLSFIRDRFTYCIVYSNIRPLIFILVHLKLYFIQEYYCIQNIIKY